jgi:hypothetical protein
MSLDEQIQELIDDAPDQEEMAAQIKAIAPALKRLAQQLRHLQYYIVQTLDQDWAITTLSNNDQPDLEKTVIYAFPTLKDVNQSPYPMQDANLIALPVPVIHILFQMLAMDLIDSTIFFETPDNLITGTEIQRVDVQAMVESEFLHPQTSGNALPPDIA